MKILITGDAGFVGRHFRKYFEGQGHEIVGVDIVNGVDARDFFRTDNTYFDRVIHLAAVVGGRKLIEGSPLSLAVDLAIDAEMFGWALRTRPGCVTLDHSQATAQTKPLIIRFLVSLNAVLIALTRSRFGAMGSR